MNIIDDKSISRILLTASVVICLLTWGCGNDGGSGPVTADDPITFVRADSSIVSFAGSTETYVWCDDWEPGEVSTPALHVWVGTLSPDSPHWWLRSVTEDIALEVPLTFPNHFIWNEPDSVHIFLGDPPNELATDTENASGTIRFHQLPCPGSGLVEFSIDAVLGSEFGGMPPVAVRGRFSTQVTAPPPWWTPGR